MNKLSNFYDMLSELYDTIPDDEKHLKEIRACETLMNYINEELEQVASAWAIPENVLVAMKNEQKNNGVFDIDYCKHEVDKIWNYRKSMFSTLKFTKENISFVEKTLIKDLQKFAIVDIILHTRKTEDFNYGYIVNLGNDICLNFEITIDDKFNENICLGGMLGDYKLVIIDRLEERLS